MRVRMKQFLFPACFVLVMLTACAQSPTTKTNNKDQLPNQTTNKKTNTVKADVMKFVKHEVRDVEGSGIVASTNLIPAGWLAQDRLYWEYRDPTVPIRYKGIFKSADGSMAIQVYPDVRASWYSGPSGTNGYKPSDILTGLRDLIKAERGLNVRITEQKIVSNSQPQSSYQQSSMISSSSQAGFIRIEYEENNQTFEEEFYGQLDVSDLQAPSAMGNMETIIWGAGSLYSCKAPKGKLGECRRIALTARSSARLTLPFYNKLAQVIQLLSDQYYAQIYQAGQISRIISQTNDQMLANIDASYQQTQKTYDRINDQFSDYMRGVDRYSDGNTQIQLPSGYQNAWRNDRGEYLLSNTQGYNPNTELSGTWKSLQKGNP